MKKLLILMLATMLLVGCSSPKTVDAPPANQDSTATERASDENESKPAQADILQIKEKMFIQQINDIYINASDYENKTIQLEGMYQEWAYEGETYCSIYRKTPGCCGDDGEIGFQIVYDGAKPKQDDWIQVTGNIKNIEEEDGNSYIVLEISDLKVESERGAEFVTT